MCVTYFSQKLSNNNSKSFLQSFLNISAVLSWGFSPGTPALTLMLFKMKKKRIGGKKGHVAYGGILSDGMDELQFRVPSNSRAYKVLPAGREEREAPE